MNQAIAYDSKVEDYGQFYNIDDDLSHNCAVTMIAGARGYGKTYGVKKKFLKTFIEKGWLFAVIKRTQIEIDKMAPNYFKDIMEDIYINDTMKYKSGKFYFNNKLCGYAFALSTGVQEKGSSFHGVHWGVFEEFIADTTKGQRYLPNEFEIHMDLMDSIYRHRNFKHIMLGNYVSLYCPYVTGWKVTPKSNKQILMKSPNKLVMFHILEDNPKFIEFKKSTLMGRLHAESGTEDYNIYNNSLVDNKTFIRKKSGTSIHTCNFSFMGDNYGFWIDRKNGIGYLSYDINPNCRFNYALTTKDHKPNMMLMKAKHRGIFSKMFDYYSVGCLRFEDLYIKNKFDEIMFRAG